MFKYRNTILISKFELTIENDQFESIKHGSFHISKCKSIPHIAHGNYIIFGWLWSSVTGQLFSPSEYQCLTKENYLDCMEEYSGRYLVLTSDGYLFTDATSSFPVYFNASYISTNLSRLCEADGIKQYSDKGVYSKPLVLPPCTHVPGVNRLMPGGYLGLGDMQAELFSDFLKPKNASEATKDNVVKCLKHNACGIERLVRQDYRLMLTGGKDSRLSLLCLKAISNSKLKTFTHKKHWLYNDPNDITIPRKLSKVLKLDHMFTAPAKQSMPDSYHQHCVKLTQEQQPGSTNYYYEHANWMQVKEKFLIDNYYEIGRMHLHTNTPDFDSIGFEKLNKLGMVLNKEHYSELREGLIEISGGVNLLDAYYFVKNYTNVAEQFELIDYSHNPLIFCNSLLLIRLLLSVTESERAEGAFHMKLLSTLNLDTTAHITCNPNSTTFLFKSKRKIKAYLSRLHCRVKWISR